MAADFISWVTPFTFVSGVGLIILSTANRFHNVNNLIRAFSVDNNDKTYLKMLIMRSQLFHKALTALYLSMGGFSISALIGNINSSFFENSDLGVYIATGLTSIGVAAVVYCSIILIKECTLSFRLIKKHEEKLITSDHSKSGA